MIDSNLFTKLFEIYPEAFSTTKSFHRTITIATPWGLEYEKDPQEETVTLAECILTAAQAISNKYGADEAEKYLEVFGKKTVQRQETKNFYSR